MKHLSFLVISALGTCITSVQAQTGTDSCTTPDLLVGTGSFAFNNTTATTGPDGQVEALCNQLGSTTILADVWFVWTAPTSGLAVIETCGITGVDTKIAIYAGTTCPVSGTALACNDDNCSVGYQSNLSTSVTGGNSYVIQLGLYPGTFPPATPGAGQISINIAIPPSNDSCTTPVALPGPGVYTANNTFASTGPEGQAESLCNQIGFTDVINDIWFTYTPATNGLVTVTTCGVPIASANDDSKIAIYAGAGCPTLGSAIACNDDNCPASPSFGFESTVSFTAVCGTTYLIQFGMYGGSGNTDYYNGDMGITETGGTVCGPTATPFCLGDGTGAACPCANNSTTPGSGCATTGFPGGATLTATGVASDETSGTDTLVLTGTGLAGPALFIQSTGTSVVNFGDGHLCAAIGITRLGVVFPTATVASYPGGLTPNEIHIQGGCVSGDVRHYQAWYRSTPALCNPGVQNFDLTQGLTITWGP